MNELCTTVSKVLNTLGSCPEEYRTQADLYVEEDETAVVLTALRGMDLLEQFIRLLLLQIRSSSCQSERRKSICCIPQYSNDLNNGSLQASPKV